MVLAGYLLAEKAVDFPLTCGNLPLHWYIPPTCGNGCGFPPNVWKSNSILVDFHNLLKWMWISPKLLKAASILLDFHNQWKWMWIPPHLWKSASILVNFPHFWEWVWISPNVLKSFSIMFDFHSLWKRVWISPIFGNQPLLVNCLVWLKQWPELNDWLMSADAKIRKTAVPTLVDFNLNFKWPCGRKCSTYRSISMTKEMHLCGTQDLRNLCHPVCTTTLGERAIMKCKYCNHVNTSKDLAVAKIIDLFSKENIYNNRIQILTTSVFWMQNLILSNLFLQIERHIMESLMPKLYQQQMAHTYILYKRTRCPLP